MGDEAEPPEGAAAANLRCDFCGEKTSHVRRVALDRDYDRLQAPHALCYACERCSREKEKQRLGGERPPPRVRRALDPGDAFS